MNLTKNKIYIKKKKDSNVLGCEQQAKLWIEEVEGRNTYVISSSLISEFLWQIHFMFMHTFNFIV